MLVAVNDKADQLLGRVEKFIKDANGAGARVERLGKKQLAYVIKKQTEATYFVVNFEAEGEAIKPIWDKLRLVESLGFILLPGYLLGFTLIAHIVLQRREPTATLAWVLGVLFVPYLGALLYLVALSKRTYNDFGLGRARMEDQLAFALAVRNNMFAGLPPAAGKTWPPQFNPDSIRYSETHRPFLAKNLP